MRKILTLLVLTAISLTGSAQAWIELGTGSSAINANNTITSIVTDTAGHIYAAGAFTDTASTDSGYTYVAMWNGSVWSRLVADSNNFTFNNTINAIATDMAGNVYAAGAFTDDYLRQCVVRWNGTQWSEVGIDTLGLNIDQNIYALTTDTAGHIYAAGAFTDSLFSFGGHYYVAEWIDTQWIEVGFGSASALDANGPINTLTKDNRNNIYAAGTFTDINGYSYVAKWDGTIWAELGTGAHALNPNNIIQTIIADTAGNIYAAGMFTDSAGYYYIAKWSGINWTELHSDSDAVALTGSINALTIDSTGNILAAGNIPDSNGNNFIVVKWNGSQLIEAGNIEATAPILSLAVGRSEDVYAAGQFTDANASEYVADYTTNIPISSGISEPATSPIYIYPNPTSGSIYVQADHPLSPMQIELYDNLGRLLYTVPDGPISTYIDLAGYAVGVYTLVITDSNKRIIKKVIKE